MIRINGLSTEDSLDCVKLLKKANLPLCIINIKNNLDWINQLKEIAFKEDLFIAVEGVKTIEDAYIAAANGAQFYILEEFNFEYMKQLKSTGFTFIPKVSNLKEIKLVEQLELECVISTEKSLLSDSNLYNILDNPNLKDIKLNEPDIFAIVDLDLSCSDYELWANSLIKTFLNLNYTEISYCETLDLEKSDFVEMFSSTNKCKIIKNEKDTITLECSDLIRAVNYFKWKNIYIDPINTEMENGNILKGILDRKLNGFSIILKEVK